MEIKINLPDELIEPLKKVCKGFEMNLERGLETIITDWIASMDAQLYIFEQWSTPSYRAFDWQFTVDYPEGEPIETLYQTCRINHINYFAGHFDFFYERVNQFEKQDALIKKYTSTLKGD